MVNWEDGQLIQEAYVEINGTRYPVVMPQYSGNTPMTSENLNKMQIDTQNEIDAIQTQINDKNIITAGLSRGFTISTAGNNDLTLDKIIAQVGDKLSLSNGKIVIGEGVNHILVSGEGMMGITTSGAKNFVVTHNDNECLLSMNTYQSVSSNVNHSRGLGAKLVPVAEGDTIGFRVYGDIGDNVSDVNTRNYITVEVVD